MKHRNWLRGISRHPYTFFILFTGLPLWFIPVDNWFVSMLIYISYCIFLLSYPTKWVKYFWRIPFLQYNEMCKRIDQTQRRLINTSNPNVFFVGENCDFVILRIFKGNYFLKPNYLFLEAETFWKHVGLLKYELLSLTCNKTESGIWEHSDKVPVFLENELGPLINTDEDLRAQWVRRRGDLCASLTGDCFFWSHFQRDKFIEIYKKDLKKSSFFSTIKARTKLSLKNIDAREMFIEFASYYSYYINDYFILYQGGIFGTKETDCLVLFDRINKKHNITLINYDSIMGLQGDYHNFTITLKDETKFYFESNGYGNNNEDDGYI